MHLRLEPEIGVSENVSVIVVIAAIVTGLEAIVCQIA
jgi:hypothetical protein